MNSTVKEIAGGKWWKVDFHVHTPASIDYGKGSQNPEKDKNVTSYSVKPKSIDFTGFDDIYLPQNKSRE